MAISSSFMSTVIDQDALHCHTEIEPKGLFGIPDYMIANITQKDNSYYIISIAFEMKLSKWKRALAQAYRYRAFANISYVMIDDHHINPAKKNIEMFIRSNVGLLSIDDNGVVKIHFEPTHTSPYSEILYEKFNKRILSNYFQKNINYFHEGIGDKKMHLR